MDAGGAHEPVQLQPFIHQVGGHSSMFCLDETTVCKPMVTREVHFYETLPEAMHQFTPEYRGVIEVNMTENPDGYVTLTAYPPYSHKTSKHDGKRTPETRHRLRMRRSGSVEIESEQNELFEEVGNPVDDGKGGTTHNPWVLKCHRDHLSKLTSQSTSENRGTKLIVLENLTWRYSYPCVLDLKMGVRQYGDDATPAKQQSQIKKVNATTSSKLGVRVCGMQVYQVNLHRFICRNKYYGRRLTVDGFKEALCQFLHNGRALRLDVIPAMIARMLELKSVLENLEGFRFYTSSLLLIYDGEERDNAVMHLSPSDSQDPTSSSAYKSCTGGVVATSVKKAQSSDDLERIDNRKSVGVNQEQQETGKYHYSSIKYNHRRRSNSKPPLADIRIIDFAHATQKGFQDPVEHSGPDQGLIFGLENVVSVLKSIQHEYC